MSVEERRASRVGDHLAFEWPWARALFFLVLIGATAAAGPWTRWQMVIFSATAACLCSIAAGVQSAPSNGRVFWTVGGIGAALGALIPAALVATAWITIAAALAVLILGLRYYHPYRVRRVRLGDSYKIAGTAWSLGGLQIGTRRLFYARQDILDELIELADYTDRFLARHDIRYVMCCGTLLGALRHSGPIPWDDDVDFTIYRAVDIDKLETTFAALAVEVERDGYQLFSHNDYWKLSKKGFWRYPVVDLYRAQITLPESANAFRVPWGPLMLCAPENAREYIVSTYSEDSLTTIVFDIPFWDSGFVPAAVRRLLGLRLSNLLGDAYDVIFKRS